MALTDLEQFIRERLQAYDPNIDLSAGSQADSKIIQPMLTRYGADPFTMELEKFIMTRLAQEFPDMSVAEGDGTMDLVVKPFRVLAEPIVQEIKRVKDNMSFATPDAMTVTEAEALGANLFVPRERGDYARVPVRLYFTAARDAVATPANYCYTGTGLRFLPTSVQTISAAEMSFNRELNYYYFDVNTVAEQPGPAYNVGALGIIGVYGITSVIKVANKVNAINGLPDEDTTTYAGRIEQDLSERSLVTQRGISAVLGKNFPGLTHVAVVGFNDPEMQRDIIQGDGIGAILAFGVRGLPTADGDGAAFTRRFRVTDPTADFTSLLGPAGVEVSGYTLTVAGPCLTSGSCADFNILRVVDSKTVDVTIRGFHPWYAGLGISYWMVRKNQLTLSGVAGGTELPSATGTVTVPSGEVHIGGMTDIYARASAPDQGAVDLSDVTDDEPLLIGVAATEHLSIISGLPDGFILGDYVLGTDYYLNDPIYQYLDEAKDQWLVLQLLDGDVGSYRILDVVQAIGSAPIIYTDPVPLGYPLNQRWRLIDKIDIDLLEPKETRISGSDMLTVQGGSVATVPSVADLSVYGVAKDSILELLNGPDKGVFTILADTTNNQVLVDRDFTFSLSSVAYRIYRKLSTEALNLPLVRIRSIDVLDTSFEPIGSTIPLADPVDVRAFDFTTPTNAPLIDVRDAIVGCVGKSLTSVPALTTKDLTVSCPEWMASVVITFAACAALEDIVGQINAATPEPVASIIDSNRLAIAPFRGQYTVTVSDGPTNSALTDLFDATSVHDTFATNFIRSDTVSTYLNQWDTYAYDADFDCVQVTSVSGTTYASHAVSVQSQSVLQVQEDMLPAVNAIVTVGRRAVGVARAYFLEPTTWEAGAAARFEAVLGDGTKLGFVPDRTISSLRYPPPPSTDRDKDATTSNIAGTYGQLGSASVDFIKKNILPGDLLTVDFVPITGDRAIAGSTVPGLAFTTINLKMAGALRTIVFSNDDPTDLTAVTVVGVEQQINRVLGANVAVVTSGGFLEFEPSYELELIDGTALGFFWMVFPVGGISNLSANYNGGKPYTIFHVSKNTLETLELFSTSTTRQQFKITRPGTQRVGTTQMALNKTYAGLYYADVQLVSEGTGTQYNIQRDQKMSVTGHTSLGYSLSNRHPHLAFSTAEEPVLHITPTIITPGASDDPENALNIPGQNLRINYDWSSLIASLQGFVSSESERVVNENALARHLLPHYIRYDLIYRGGQTESAVLAASQAYIDGLNPDDSLEAVKLQNIPMTLGANSVSTPINLVALIYNEDRTVGAEQSTNYLNTGRLAAFFSDLISIQRRTS